METYLFILGDKNVLVSPLKVGLTLLLPFEVPLDL